MSSLLALGVQLNGESFETMSIIEKTRLTCDWKMKSGHGYVAQSALRKQDALRSRSVRLLFSEIKNMGTTFIQSLVFCISTKAPGEEASFMHSKVVSWVVGVLSDGGGRNRLVWEARLRPGLGMLVLLPFSRDFWSCWSLHFGGLPMGTRGRPECCSSRCG